MHTFAPVFPVSDFAASLAHYAGLGFTTDECIGDSAPGGYGFARRDAVELHLGTVPIGHIPSPATAYLSSTMPMRSPTNGARQVRMSDRLRTHRGACAKA